MSYRVLISEYGKIKFEFWLLNLLKVENHPYEIYLITQLFSHLKNSNIFCISYKLRKKCQFCEIDKLNTNTNMFLELLIKVYNDNNDYEIEKIINNLLGVIYSRYPLCCYNEGKIIDNNKISICLKTEWYDIKMNIYLSFILDVEISENSNINFKELLKHQNYWNKVLKKSFKLSNKRYNS